MITADKFTALVQSLGLASGLFKPVPTPSSDLAGISALNNTIASGLPIPADPLQGDDDVNISSKHVDCNVDPYDSPPFDVSFAPFDPIRVNVYRYRQQHSVNLGSWFVHEKWMTPSLWACAANNRISEFDIAAGWGSPAGARAVLERHWDTFIQQGDLDYLASIGINTVRVPIGYWNLGPDWCRDTPYDAVGEVYANSWNRVLHAIKMAEGAGIGVLVDLHGAVGSQNGQDHSGVSDRQVNLFSTPAYMDKTIDVLVYLAEQLVHVTNVVGIQLLNEPVDDPGLPTFYDRAISAMRIVSPSAASLPLYIHDAFNLNKYSDYVSQRWDFVVEDHHSYFVYTPRDASEPAYKHTQDIQTGTLADLAGAAARERRNLIVGEWSCALAPQSLAREADQNQARRDFCEGQMAVYDNATAGWAFWSYMKEDCASDPGWCFKAAVGNSLPSSFFAYGNGPPSSAALAKLSAHLAKDPPTAASSLVPRRGTHHHNTHHHHRRTSPSAARGYEDGFGTANVFAAYGLSKLGFVDQYVHYSIGALGPAVVQPGTEDDYRAAFLQGLQDAEAAVDEVLAG